MSHYIIMMVIIMILIKTSIQIAVSSHLPLIVQQISDQRISDQQISDQRISDQQISDQQISDQQISDQRISDQQKIQQQEQLLQQLKLQQKYFESLENHAKNNGQGSHGQWSDFKSIGLTSGHDSTVPKNLDTKKKTPRYETPRSDSGMSMSEKGTVKEVEVEEVERIPDQRSRMMKGVERIPDQGSRMMREVERIPDQGSRMMREVERIPDQGSRMMKEVERIPDQGSRMMRNPKERKSVQKVEFERESSELNRQRKSVESDGKIHEEMEIKWDDEQPMKIDELTTHAQRKDDQVMNDVKITKIMTTNIDGISNLKQKMATPTSFSTLSTQNIVTASGEAEGIEKRQDEATRPVWLSRAPSLLSSNALGTKSIRSFPKELQYSSSQQQMAPPSREPEVRLDYPDLKGRYNYFPPSMFVNYEQEARDKIYNTIHGQINANGFFVPANQLRGSFPNHRNSHQLSSSTISSQQVSPSNTSRSQSGYNPLNGNHRTPTPYHGYGLSPSGATSAHASTYGDSDKETSSSKNEPRGAVKIGETLSSAAQTPARSFSGLFGHGIPPLYGGGYGYGPFGGGFGYGPYGGMYGGHAHYTPFFHSLLPHHQLMHDPYLRSSLMSPYGLGLGYGHGIGGYGHGFGHGHGHGHGHGYGHGFGHGFGHYSPLYAPYSFLGGHGNYGHLDRSHSHSSAHSSSSEHSSEHAHTSAPIHAPVAPPHVHPYEVHPRAIAPPGPLLGSPGHFGPPGPLLGPSGHFGLGPIGPPPPIIRPSTFNKYIDDEEDLSERSESKIVERKFGTGSGLKEFGTGSGLKEFGTRSGLKGFGTGSGLKVAAVPNFTFVQKVTSTPGSISDLYQTTTIGPRGVAYSGWTLEPIQTSGTRSNNLDKSGLKNKISDEK